MIERQAQQNMTNKTTVRSLFILKLAVSMRVALLLVACADALHLAMSDCPRHRHVSMGMFDAIKSAFDDIQLERSASAVHVKPTHRLSCLLFCRRHLRWHRACRTAPGASGRLSH